MQKDPSEQAAQQGGEQDDAGRVSRKMAFLQILKGRKQGKRKHDREGGGVKTTPVCHLIFKNTPESENDENAAARTEQAVEKARAEPDAGERQREKKCLFHFTFDLRSVLRVNSGADSEK